jgi:hypothetical protein
VSLTKSRAECQSAGPPGLPSSTIDKLHQSLHSARAYSIVVGQRAPLCAARLNHEHPSRATVDDLVGRRGSSSGDHSYLADQIKRKPNESLGQPRAEPDLWPDRAVRVDTAVHMTAVHMMVADHARSAAD